MASESAIDWVSGRVMRVQIVSDIVCFLSHQPIVFCHASNYSTINGESLPIFNFDRLDKFLWKLTNDYGLNPTIEFMTVLKGLKIDELTWESLAYQLVARYIGL